MNHLKMFKRFQEGTGNVLGPGELARIYMEILKDNELQRAERLNEVEGHGDSADVIYPEELELKRKEDQLKAQRALELAMNSKQYAQGTGDVMDLERGNWPVSEEELKTLPDWLAHLLRGIPEKHTHGSQREQFMPRSVPVMQGPQGRYYDPRYSADDERIMAKEGDTDVEPLKLAGGSNRLPSGFTAFWPGGGRWEGHNRVAAGQNILGGQPWQYYDIGNPNAPWIGLEGPRGSLGQWVDIPGESRRGRVIDVKQKGYGGYGILKKGRYDSKGNYIPGSGGGGQGGTIPGGPFEGWTPQAMEQWHSGTPPSGMNYPEFTGNTAGPGGQQLAYETTSYNIPGYGWVPRATLANAQASNNLWDYLNPFGGTSKGGSGTGDPTQRGVGMAVGTASNLIIPGLGFVTGPIARYITSLFQKNPGITREQIVQAVAVKAKEDPAMVAPPPAAPSGGSGTDPWGNPDTGNRWSNDFGRGMGGPSLSSAGGTKFGQFGTGFGTGTVGNFNTAIGFGGSYGGGSNAGDTSRFMGGAGYSRPYTSQQWANLPGSMKYPAPTLSNAFGGITPRMSYEDYVQGFHAPGTVGSSTGPGGAAYSGGGPQGIGGGKTSFKPNVNQKVFAEGTSDVSPYELAGAWGTKFLPLESSDWRKSGVVKGPGFLGPLRRPDGQTSTELSVGVGTDKGETEIPSLVPGLTKEEVDYLLGGGRPTKAIIDKAISHARLRRHAGRDPFYEYGESPSPLRYAMGTSDVNPGLKLFHTTQLKRKKL